VPGGGQSKGALCFELSSGGSSFCVAPQPGQAIQLAYVNWIWFDSGNRGFGILVIGAITRDVASVRVSLGAGRWATARIVSAPPELAFPLRLFYVEKRTGFDVLNRHLPIVALDDQGHEIGRTSYFFFLPAPSA
jgi:hypothetical protein